MPRRRVISTASLSAIPIAVVVLSLVTLGLTVAIMLLLTSRRQDLHTLASQAVAGTNNIGFNFNSTTNLDTAATTAVINPTIGRATNVQTTGGTWGQLDGLASPPLSTTGNPAALTQSDLTMHVDAQGLVNLVWLSSSAGDYEIDFARYVPGVGWRGIDSNASPVDHDILASVSAVSGHTLALPKFTIGPSGDLLVAYFHDNISFAGIGRVEFLKFNTTTQTWRGFVGSGADVVDAASGVDTPCLAPPAESASGLVALAYCTAILEDPTGGNAADIGVVHSNGASWTGSDASDGLPNEDVVAESDNIDASNVQLVLTSEANPAIHVGWIEDAGAAAKAYESHLSGGGTTWTGFNGPNVADGKARIDDLSTHAAGADGYTDSLALAVSGTTVHAVFGKLPSGIATENLYYSRTTGSDWSGFDVAGIPDHLDDVDAIVTVIGSLGVTVDLIGNPYVFFSGSDTGDAYVSYHTSGWAGPGGGARLHTFAKATFGSGSATAEKLVVDPQNRPHFVVLANVSAGTGDYFAQYLSGGTWTSLEQVDGDPAKDNVTRATQQFAGVPSLELDANGLPAVANIRTTPDDAIEATRFNPPLVSNGVVQSTDLNTTGEPIGSITVTCTVCDPGAGTIALAVSFDGTNFSAVTSGVPLVATAVSPAGVAAKAGGSSVVWRATLTSASNSSPVLDQVDVSYTTTAAAPTAGFAFERVSGSERILTGIAVNQKRFAATDSAGGALLCNSANPVDCLAASSLAVQMNAELLLNTQSGLNKDVSSEIARSTTPDDPILVLGQTSAQSDAVITGLNALGYQNVTRLGDKTRIETSAVIAAKLRSLSTQPIQRIFFASGFKGPVDALVSSSPAGIPTANGALTAVLLVKDTSVPSAISDELTHYPTVTSAFAFGGTAVLSDATFNLLQTMLPAGATLTREAGKDRYVTSTTAAAAFFNNPVAVTLAAGAAPNGGLAVDALSGGPFAASQGSPIVLVQNTALPSTVATYLGTIKASVLKLWTLGGTSAVADSVVQSAITALGH